MAATKRKPRSGGRKRSRSGFRRLALLTAFALAGASALTCAISVWFVHHPRTWLEGKRAAWPGILYQPLSAIGNSVGDLTDALALTGHDVVYEYDEEAPSGAVLFAGLPRRIGSPAPNDIVVLDRGEFKIGWSPTLRHPVWCAYHVKAETSHGFEGKRPNFRRDTSAGKAPKPGEYSSSGYDRGHLAPNYAIMTRYGESAQRKTFLTSNIAPQSPALNRTVWRNLEHRIAEFWTARYGEIWVVVGCYSAVDANEVIAGTGIDVPENFYMVIAAQEGLDIRVLAVDVPQSVDWHDYAARYLTTIDRLEEKTGLDFLCELPEFIQSPLESDLPSRLWPIRVRDLFKLLALRYDN